MYIIYMHICERQITIPGVTEAPSHASPSPCTLPGPPLRRVQHATWFCCTSLWPDRGQTVSNVSQSSCTAPVVFEADCLPVGQLPLT